jgi:DNA-binding NtrC family response regulator
MPLADEISPPVTFRDGQPFAANGNMVPESLRVLVLSPDGKLRQRAKEKLRSPHWVISDAKSGAGALQCLYENAFDVLLADTQLPDLDFDEFLSMVKERFPSVQVLLLNSMSGRLTMGTTPPSSLSEQILKSFEGDTAICAPMPLHEVQVRPGSGTEDGPGLRGVVGDSEVMRKVYALTHLVARRDTTVLITGESGTGKDLIARAVHQISQRQKQPLVTINCAAIPEALLEAELFGHEKGSFTGAMQSRTGRIQAAHGGTLFLDEIGDMPLSLQRRAAENRLQREPQGERESGGRYKRSAHGADPEAAVPGGSLLSPLSVSDQASAAPRTG